jgi:P4 family phage/plasmid primase-like protien
MIFEGEGANGKSVACAAIEAMLGPLNCSHVQFEVFGDRFSKTQTLGKRVNICGDAGEIDQVAEGIIKAFVSGNPMLFDRKGMPGINCAPTARMMIACNNLPRFRDRSDGIWRRVLLIPWNYTVSQHERIRNMDKAWWWEASGELPGILNWALVGLHRLKEQGGFTDCDEMNRSMVEYKKTSNPAKQFLSESMHAVETDPVRPKFLKSSFAYKTYNQWAKDNGYFPLSESQFGKEIRRHFPTMNRAYKGATGARVWCYAGVDFIPEAIDQDGMGGAYVYIDSDSNQ